MPFLIALELIIAVAFLWFIITQLIIPAFSGGRLFPAFRSSPIREEVDATREHVNDLVDKQAALKEHNALVKKMQELYTEIDKLEEEKAAVKAKAETGQAEVKVAETQSTTNPTTGANQQ